MHDFSVESGQWVPPIDSNTRIHMCNEFKGNLSMGVWNSTALFCRDPVMAPRRLQYAMKLASKVDVLVILEAHGQNGSEVILKEQLRKTHYVEYHPGISQATGGVVICVKHRIIQLCGQPVTEVIDVGRIICMKFTSQNERLVVFGVHVDPHYTLEKKKQLIRMISTRIHLLSGVSCFVCGDFNFEALGDKAYNANRGSFMDSAASELLGTFWNTFLGDLLEHHQTDFTRAQTGPHGVTLSRLDRIYSNMPAWRLLSTEVRTSTEGSVTDADRLSDHVPVLSFVNSSRQHSQRPLAVWTTRDPYYRTALQAEIERYNFEKMSPAQGVQRMKLCMRAASQYVITKSLRRGAVTIEEQIFWSLTCLRSLFHGNAKRVVQSILAYPKLEEFVLVNCGTGSVVVTGMILLNEHVANLMRESLERLRSDVEQTEALTEYQRYERLAGVSRLMDCWATRNRKVSLQGARNITGEVIDDPDEAAKQFVEHWKKVAEAKIVDKAGAREFLKQNMRKLPEFRSVLTFDEFVLIVSELPDSACGPDGIPYAAWRHAPTDALWALYRLYCSLFTGADVAEDFNYSWLMLLAKGDHNDDGRIVARAPDDTRPVSLANSDSKICELALNQPLSKAVGDWASQEQMGFPGG